jgi:hypothetical protein
LGPLGEATLPWFSIRGDSVIRGHLQPSASALREISLCVASEAPASSVAGVLTGKTHPQISQMAQMAKLGEPHPPPEAETDFDACPRMPEDEREFQTKEIPSPKDWGLVLQKTDSK